jgi:hypothetical protein
MVPEEGKKKRYKQINYIPSQHTVGDPQNQIFSRAFANFWGPPTNPPTTIFMGPNSNFTMGEFVLLGSLPNPTFTPGLLPILGAHWGLFGFRGLKSNFISGAFTHR